MKTFEITNSNGKGLFVKNEEKECNISDIVKQETPVEFTANGKSVIIAAYNKRDFHREDSAFEYFLQGEESNAGIKNVHGKQCADIKKLLGYEPDKKPRGEKEGRQKKTFISLFDELKKYEPTEDELNSILEYYAKEKENRKNKERINELNGLIREKESKYNTLIEFNAKTQANGLKKEIDKLKEELKELTK